MKDKPKTSSDEPLETPKKLTSEEVWRNVERNLGYKLVPLKFDEKGEIIIDRSDQNPEEK